MLPPLSLTLVLALSTTTPSSFEVRGDVRDAVFLEQGDGAGLWVSRTLRRGQREMVLLSEQGQEQRTVAVPKGAVAVDACAGRGLVFSDARGVVDASGARLLEGAVLLGVPDPEALYRAPLCGRVSEARGELRVAVSGGLLVRAADGATVKLPFTHRARAYSGELHRGLRVTRPYSMALSLYAPHLADADVNGDGRVDLVVVHEGRVGVFVRDATGKLTPNGAVVRDLQSRLSSGDDTDVRVLTGDLDGDARADVVLSLTQGVVPERSSVHVVEGRSLLQGGAPKTLWRRDGLSAPLGLVKRGKSRAVVVSEVDTSLVALGAALFTGEVPLKVLLHDGASKSPRPVLSLMANIDVRGGKMAGAMPVVSVDFDGDGQEDLLDLARQGRAALHRGTASGFAEQPSSEHSVAPFEHVVPVAALPGVVLVGEPKGGKTRLTILKGGARGSSRY